MTKTIHVKTTSRTEFIDITSDVKNIVNESGVNSGVCYVYVPHTTAGVTINEGADPAVARDILSTLNSLIPRSNGYLHMEGNSDAHIKTSLVGPSQTVIIEGGNLLLGTWQAVFFCEFDGSRSRNVMVKIIERER
jgi:secondary thiamine-phosphate synthase enzyme